MDDPNFTDHMTNHIASRQPPRGVSEQVLDQVEAAALDGARSVDGAASTGRESGALVNRSTASPGVFNRLGERHGNPLTELQECIHLVAVPIQPRYIYCAEPEKVRCENCLTAFFADNGEAIHDYDASTDCDVCGAETEVEDFHIGNLSNGMVTYYSVKICSDCLAIGP